ncbi:MAG: hypothetical protein H6739_09090 [Alphaproteobacteria bacterium]|nr:hypothetical protein [Alphaproteobacteria bacterium]
MFDDPLDDVSLDAELALLGVPAAATPVATAADILQRARGSRGLRGGWRWAAAILFSAGIGSGMTFYEGPVDGIIATAVSMVPMAVGAQAQRQEHRAPTEQTPQAAPTAQRIAARSREQRATPMIEPPALPAGPPPAAPTATPKVASMTTTEAATVTPSAPAQLRFSGGALASADALGAQASVGLVKRWDRDGLAPLLGGEVELGWMSSGPTVAAAVQPGVSLAMRRLDLDLGASAGARLSRDAEDARRLEPFAGPRVVARFGDRRQLFASLDAQAALAANDHPAPWVGVELGVALPAAL